MHLNRYTDIEFATTNGSIVAHEEPFYSGRWSGAQDYSLTTMLKWDHAWLYLAVVNHDDVFELSREGDACWRNGLQIAIEVGGEDSRGIDGRSSLGLVQALRSTDIALSRLVLLNVGIGDSTTSCSCDNCQDSDSVPTSGCCTHYQNHGAPSPSGHAFQQRLKVRERTARLNSNMFCAAPACSTKLTACGSCTLLMPVQGWTALWCTHDQHALLTIWSPCLPLLSPFFRVQVAIQRNEETKQTIYEVAVHIHDIMYPDWPGRNPTALSRWQPGTRFGFSLLLWEGEELEKDDGGADSLSPNPHSFGGYYPHVRPFHLGLCAVTAYKHRGSKSQICWTNTLRPQHLRECARVRYIYLNIAFSDGCPAGNYEWVEQGQQRAVEDGQCGFAGRSSARPIRADLCPNGAQPAH